jgi:hypothetical protein
LLYTEVDGETVEPLRAGEPVLNVTVQFGNISLQGPTDGAPWERLRASSTLSLALAFPAVSIAASSSFDSSCIAATSASSRTY